MVATSTDVAPFYPIAERLGRGSWSRHTSRSASVISMSSRGDRRFLRFRWPVLDFRKNNSLHSLHSLGRAQSLHSRRLYIHDSRRIDSRGIHSRGSRSRGIRSL